MGGEIRPTGVVVYSEDYELIILLPPDEGIQLVAAMYRYATKGVLPDFAADSRLAEFWESRQKRINKDVEVYQNTTKQRSEAGKRSGEKRREKAEQNKRPLNDR